MKFKGRSKKSQELKANSRWSPKSKVECLKGLIYEVRNTKIKGRSEKEIEKSRGRKAMSEEKKKSKTWPHGGGGRNV